MLIATPYRSLDLRENVSPPKVISEIRKNYDSENNNNDRNGSSNSGGIRVKLSGDLPIRYGNEKNWTKRRATIKGGHLYITSIEGEDNKDGHGNFRLPLRHLSLQAGSLPHSLSLCRGLNVVLTLQTANERAFDVWVKTIAIELIRQTPLDAIRYLDILVLAECWKHKTDEDYHEKDCQSLPNNEKLTSSCDSNIVPHKQSLLDGNHNLIEEKPDEKNIEDLLKLCQNSKKYVPVKDKLYLFENLYKMDRKVRSTEDVSLGSDRAAKRTRSMYDLSNLNKHIVVRDICKYFENKSEEEVMKNISTNIRTRRLVNSDSHLDDVYRFQKVYTT